ncbi:MAG: hypothetical protein U0670_00585 [Anaerolineae bacterium]
MQVTAWYNGLGYEYTFIDGMPYKQNVGRIRLQEIPEGTVVQWTFSYDSKGLFKGGRQIETTIADSLRTLYKQLQNAAQRRPLEAKSLMRDDPGVEARATYKPRHPAEVKPEPLTVHNEPPLDEGDNRQIPVVNRFAIPEPPVVESDTRPRPPVTSPAAPSVSREPSLPVLPLDEPDFLRELDAPPRAEDMRFMPPVRIEEPPVQKGDTKPVRPVIPDTPAPSASTSQEIPLITLPPAVEPAAVPPVKPAAYTAPTIEQFTPPPPVLEPETTSQSLPQLKTSDAEEDTTSIWDVFGLPRPSATQEMRALQAEAAKFEHPLEVQPPRMGLRTFQRRQIVALRRPKNK